MYMNVEFFLELSGATISNVAEPILSLHMCLVKSLQDEEQNESPLSTLCLSHVHALQSHTYCQCGNQGWKAEVDLR